MFITDTKEIKTNYMVKCCKKWICKKKYDRITLCLHDVTLTHVNAVFETKGNN